MPHSCAPIAPFLHFPLTSRLTVSVLSLIPASNVGVWPSKTVPKVVSLHKNAAVKGGFDKEQQITAAVNRLIMYIAGRFTEGSKRFAAKIDVYNWIALSMRQYQGEIRDRLRPSLSLKFEVLLLAPVSPISSIGLLLSPGPFQCHRLVLRLSIRHDLVNRF